jgi:putative restriction endonuclease
MELGRPLIYLVGIKHALYQPFFPASITAATPDNLDSSVLVDFESVAQAPLRVDVVARAPDREYATRAVKVRLHQRRFRELVMRAYRTRCAICSLRHDALLDAAHIIADSDLRGVPEIPNGLALCKIHHSAYDLNILGIDPDYGIHIRADILQEHDGPMLQHGLKEMDGHDLRVLPHAAEQKPNREFLAERFERWRAA